MQQKSSAASRMEERAQVLRHLGLSEAMALAARYLSAYELPWRSTANRVIDLAADPEALALARVGGRASGGAVPYPGAWLSID